MKQINKETILLCEDGHEVCELSKDLVSTTLISHTLFCNFRKNQKETQPCEQLEQYCFCGKKWAWTDLYDLYFNFKDIGIIGGKDLV